MTLGFLAAELTAVRDAGATTRPYRCVITDFDQTLSHTREHQWFRTVLDAARAEVFAGAASYLQLQDAVYVLSSTPRFLVGRIRRGLRREHIPVWDARTRRRLWWLEGGLEFKTERILEIIRSCRRQAQRLARPLEVILIGDDYNQDEQTMTQVLANPDYAPDVKAAYIHPMLGQPLAPSIERFWLWADIAASEFLAGRIDLHELRIVLTQTLVEKRERLWAPAELRLVEQRVPLTTRLGAVLAERRAEVLRGAGPPESRDVYELLASEIDAHLKVAYANTCRRELEYRKALNEGLSGNGRR